MKTKPNESAFPVPQVLHLGLTKREYFAAIALQALLTHNNNYGYAVTSAVEYADDLIEELSKTKINEKK